MSEKANLMLNTCFTLCDKSLLKKILNSTFITIGGTPSF